MTEPTPSTINFGNAADDSADSKGWFIGSFFDPSLGFRHSDDVEVKWGIHEAGETREDWVTGETRTALALLISGRFEVVFRDQTIPMEKQGDYVMWGPGTDHKWHCLEDSVILTVRWPSITFY
jgi:hypothetical protein